MNGSNATPGRPSFEEVYDRVRRAGEVRVVSTRGTEYRVTAEVTNAGPTLIAHPARGQVRIHEDCWGDDLTCQGTRAGGVYHGSPSLFDCPTRR
ncbi:MAG: hypothetical protein ACLQHS_05275 [Candidatus Limnocylindrales bacterium]